MRYAWFPRPYMSVWLMFLASAALWQLQTANPERFNIYVIVNLGQRMTGMLGGLTVLGTVWLLFDSWEQQIVKKTRSTYVELARIDRFYGGIVYVRRVPKRVWAEASAGDLLIKRPWTIYAELVHRRKEPGATPVAGSPPASPE